MKRLPLLAFSIVALLNFQQLLLPAIANPPISGDEVMRRVNGRSRGNSSQMLLEMTLNDARRGQFRKTIVMQRKRLAAGYRTAYRITAPDHENGIGLLLSEDTAQPGMWMYFPSSRQLLHVATRGFSALASDFNCEDLLVSVPLADYQFRVLGRENIDGVSAIQVEMTPRSERLRNELGISKCVGWVRDDIWLIVRADYYDENGNVFKSFHAGDIKLIQGIWTAQTFTMHNYRAQHSSEVRVVQTDYSVRLPNEAFTPDRLGSGLAASRE
jgi:hypothetical protein